MLLFTGEAPPHIGFVPYVLIESEEKNLLLETFEVVKQEIEKINAKMTLKDFELAGDNP